MLLLKYVASSMPLTSAECEKASSSRLVSCRCHAWRMGRRAWRSQQGTPSGCRRSRTGTATCTPFCTAAGWLQNG